LCFGCKFGFVGGFAHVVGEGLAPSRNLQKYKIAKDFYVAGGASPSPTAKHELPAKLQFTNKQRTGMLPSFGGFSCRILE
jgi:hypothetical protein